MNKRLEKILSIPKSFYVSWRLMGIKKAFKLPIFVRYNVCCESLSGKVKLKSGGVFHRMVTIGFGEVGIFDKKYDRTILQIQGTIIIEGVRHSVFCGHGARISVAQSGTLLFGKEFSNTAMMTIACKDRISFGDNVTVSWNVIIMDTDWHHTQNTLTEELSKMTQPIIIGDRAWLCMRSVILKGSVIPDGCIVGANSLVTKQFCTSNTLLAGNPAREIKYNVQIYNEK